MWCCGVEEMWRLEGAANGAERLLVWWHGLLKAITATPE